MTAVLYYVCVSGMWLSLFCCCLIKDVSSQYLVFQFSRCHIVATRSAGVVAIPSKSNDNEVKLLAVFHVATTTMN